MKHINWKRVSLALIFSGTLLAVLGVALLARIADMYQDSKPLLRDFTELEQHKLFLFELVDWDYKRFRFLSRVIACESSWRKDAESRTADSGYFQINRSFHKGAARILGLDIEQPMDNLRYGVILYEIYGVAPWTASKRCWK